MYVRSPSQLVITMFAALLSGRAGAEAAPDRASGHFLWSPAPREGMRAMSTDRPDTTESPYTVDAGHFQAETELASLTGDQGARSLTVMVANFKLGVTDFIDLQLVLCPYERDWQAGTDVQQGFGDTTVRVKLNLWGNDAGPTAFAFMPFVKLPTAGTHTGNGSLEGGLISVIGVALPAAVSMAFMAELDVIADAADDYGTELLLTGTAGRALLGPLGGFAELTARRPLWSSGDVAAGFDTGLNYAVTSDVVVDTGVNVGLTEAADDFRAFLGGSFRY
jgi:Putative MetA-pathway of phenol degradation